MMSRGSTLVLAATARDAERAAPFVAGDGLVVIGEDDEPDRPPSSDAVIAGGLDDQAWLEATFARADAALVPGGRVLLVLAAPSDDAQPPTEFVPVTIPASVVRDWRLVGFRAESGSAAAIFQRAADDDGAPIDAHALRLLHLNLLLAQRPDLISRLDEQITGADGRWTVPVDADPDRDAEITELRRQLDSYRFSPLGRLTTSYRSFLAAVRGRRR